MFGGVGPGRITGYPHGNPRVPAGCAARHGCSRCPGPDRSGRSSRSVERPIAIAVEGARLAEPHPRADLVDDGMPGPRSHRFSSFFNDHPHTRFASALESAYGPPMKIGPTTSAAPGWTER